MFVERLIFGQVILENGKTDVAYMDLIDNFKISIPLLVANLGVVFVLLLVCLFLNELKHRLKFGIPSTVALTRRVVLVIRRYRTRVFTTVGIVFLSFNLFLWIAQLLMIGQIGTNKVVVDTSELIKDELEIFRSQHVACFFYDQQEMSMGFQVKSAILI